MRFSYNTPDSACTRQVTGPHIILLPKSVLGNWQLEFKRFCPSIRVLRLSGTKVNPLHLSHVDRPPLMTYHKAEWWCVL